MIQSIALYLQGSQNYYRHLTCEYNFSRNKDEQDNSGFDHSVYQSREKLWFIAKTHKGFYLNN